MRGKPSPLADHSSRADEQSLNAGLASGIDHGEQIHVAVGGLDVLLLLHPLQLGDLVPIACGAFKIQPFGGALHVPLERLQDLAAAPFQKQHAQGDVAPVGLPVDEADAGCAATLDLMLQAGPGTVLEEAVIALPQAEQLLQNVEALPHRTGGGIGAEVAGLFAAGAAVETQARKVLCGGQLDVGIGLVVPQHHVVGRALPLDEALLQQQRLGFAVRDRNGDVRHLGGQGQGLAVEAAGAEIAADAALEVARLANVEHCPAAVEQAVHARLLAEAGKDGMEVRGMVNSRHGRPI